MKVESRILIYIVAIVAVIIFGTVGTYFIGQRGGFNEQITWLKALYFTVVTITTVGYGDIYPVTSLARIFVIILVVIGIGTFLVGITFIVGEFMNQRIESLTGRLSVFEKRLLKKHIVLIGTNATNMYLAERLREKDERFIMLTSDKEMAEHLKTQGYKAFVSDATSELDLLDFGLDKARAVVIDLREGSQAVYVLIVVRDIAKNAKIIVVVPKKETEHHLRSIAGGKALIVNPSDIAASMISDNLFKKTQE